MRLIDRYLFRQVMIACAAAVGFFTFVVMAVNALKRVMGFMLSGQLSVATAAELLFLLAIYAVTFALPMGVLCGVLLVLGRLSSDGEVTALRAAGMSVVRIGMPVYVFAALGTAAALTVNFHYMPRARTQFQRISAEIARGDPIKKLVPRTFIREFPGVIVYVGGFKGTELQDVWIWNLDREGRVVRLCRAETGRVEMDEPANELVFTPSVGTIEVRDVKDPENFAKDPAIGSWDNASLRFSLKGLLGRPSAGWKPDWMTLRELRAESARLALPVPPEEAENRTRERMQVRIVIQEKLATAFAVFSFALVAVPLGIKVSRRETSANLGVAVVLALTYFVLSVFIKWLDPALRPDLLLWIPNLLFAGIGVWLMRRVQRA